MVSAYFPLILVTNFLLERWSADAPLDSNFPSNDERFKSSLFWLGYICFGLVVIIYVFELHIKFYIKLLNITYLKLYISFTRMFCGLKKVRFKRIILSRMLENLPWHQSSSRKNWLIRLGYFQYVLIPCIRNIFLHTFLTWGKHFGFACGSWVSY